MSQSTSRREKSEYVLRDIFWLYDVLAVLVVGIPPTTDFDVQLTVILLGPQVVPGEHAERDGRIEGGRVSDGERVRSIAERARKLHLGACPYPLALRDDQVKHALGIDPCVTCIEVVRAVPIARHLADFPLVSAEGQNRRLGQVELTRALYGRNGGDGAAPLWQRLHRGRRTEPLIHQDRGVLEPEMNRAVPRRIGGDGCKRLRDKGLYPPDAAAPRVQHNPLGRTRTENTSCDRRNPVRAANGRDRHHSDLNGRLAGRHQVTTSQRHTDGRRQETPEGRGSAPLHGREIERPRGFCDMSR